MRKIEEILFTIFLLGLLSGIIPAIFIGLMERFPILLIITLIFDICWIMYELCYGGEQNYGK